MFLLAVTTSQTFLIFDDLDSFEEYWSNILQNIPEAPEEAGVLPPFQEVIPRVHHETRVVPGRRCHIGGDTENH